MRSKHGSTWRIAASELVGLGQGNSGSEKGCASSCTPLNVGRRVSSIRGLVCALSVVMTTTTCFSHASWEEATPELRSRNVLSDATGWPPKTGVLGSRSDALALGRFLQTNGGSCVRAVAVYERIALESDVAGLTARMYRATCLREWGRFDEACRDLTDIVQAANDAPRLRIPALYLAGQCADDLGRIDSALFYWVDLATNFPDSPYAAAAQRMIGVEQGAPRTGLWRYAGELRVRVERLVWRVLGVRRSDRILLRSVAERLFLGIALLALVFIAAFAVRRRLGPREGTVAASHELPWFTGFWPSFGTLVAIFVLARGLEAAAILCSDPRESVLSRWYSLASIVAGPGLAGLLLIFCPSFLVGRPRGAGLARLGAVAFATVAVVALAVVLAPELVQASSNGAVPNVFVPIATQGVFVLSLIAVGEELIYRGLLQGALSASIGEVASVLMTSIVFALAHGGGMPRTTIAFVFSLFAGSLMVRYRTLLVPVGFHWLYNVVIFGLAVAR